MAVHSHVRLQYLSRHTLTLNGGTYYIDTSIPLNIQRSEPFTTTGAVRDVNVFEGGQTYYVFFLYTQPSTKQTYQIYVATGSTGVRSSRYARISKPLPSNSAWETIRLRG